MALSGQSSLGHQAISNAGRKRGACKSVELRDADRRIAASRVGLRAKASSTRSLRLRAERLPPARLNLHPISAALTAARRRSWLRCITFDVRRRGRDEIGTHGARRERDGETQSDYSRKEAAEASHERAPPWGRAARRCPQEKAEDESGEAGADRREASLSWTSASDAPSIALRLPIEPVSAVKRQMFERDDETRSLWAILRQIQLTHQANAFACVKDVRHRQIRSRGVE